MRCRSEREDISSASCSRTAFSGRLSTLLAMRNARGRSAIAKRDGSLGPNGRMTVRVASGLMMVGERLMMAELGNMSGVSMLRREEVGLGWFLVGALAVLELLPIQPLTSGKSNRRDSRLLVAMGLPVTPAVWRSRGRGRHQLTTTQSSGNRARSVSLSKREGEGHIAQRRKRLARRIQLPIRFFATLTTFSIV